jgi:hypothetical protein
MPTSATEPLASLQVIFTVTIKFCIATQIGEMPQTLYAPLRRFIPQFAIPEDVLI